MALPQAASVATRVHTLHPGDVACVGRDERLETLLGSCVSIILTDPRRTVGAMCHVVHARPPLQGCTKSTSHGADALLRLFGMLRAKNIEPRLCQAWIFGGGNMFPGRIGPAAAQGNVGAANAAWAQQAMADAGIRVLGGELGGNTYRKLRWTVGPAEPELRTVALGPAGASS